MYSPIPEPTPTANITTDKTITIAGDTAHNKPIFVIFICYLPFTVAFTTQILYIKDLTKVNEYY